MVGLMEDMNHHTKQWFENEGDVIVLLGRTREELEGSEYLARQNGLAQGTPPWIDLEVELQLQQVCLAAIRDGIVCSAHDVSEGGLAVALAECCMSGPEGRWQGAEINMEGTIRPDAWLFGESQSRILLSLRRKDVRRLRELAAASDVPLTVLGEVRGRRLRIGILIDCSISELQGAWSNAIAGRMEGPSPA
jgi:phosphoribosylformylglycinamidine synthase